MAYRYRALDSRGRLCRGWLALPNEQAVIEALQQQQLEWLSITPAAWPIWQRKQLTTAQLTLFCLQLAQLLHAGIPLLQAIQDLAMHSPQPALQSQCYRLHQELEAGQMLSAAMQAEPGTFPDWLVRLVETGERTGRLAEIFSQLTATLQWQSALHSQLKRGMTYPLLLTVMLLLVVTVMLTVLVPQMLGFLKTMGQALPWSTRLLLLLSTGLQRYGGWLLTLGLMLITLLWLGCRTFSRWAALRDRCLLHLPLIGPLLQMLAIARLCRFLGLMYQSGIPLLQALAWCQPLVARQPLASALAEVHASVESGQSLTAAFAGKPYFPPLMQRLIAVGERSGSLEPMLAELARVYDQAAAEQCNWLLRLLEPALTLLLGLLLMFLMAAVMLPVYDSFSTMRY